MPATPFDSHLLSGLFPAGDTARLFSDSAEIRAMMIVEGALAQVQAGLGIIPQDSAGAIQRAAMELQIDPGALAKATAGNGVSTPALVAAFRDEMQAPEHAQYLHWGATSQDIQDSALMLRMRQALGQFDTQLGDTTTALATLAEDHADTPMAARTYGQHATATSFGALVANWGWPLLTLRDELHAIRDRGLPVSLSGAAGTGSVLGPDPAAVRAGLAEKLGLRDPGRSWHSDRSLILELAGWMARCCTALGKLGEDLVLMAQSSIGEIALAAAGSSSTMPQKQNPVAPSVLVALARHAQGLNLTLQGAGIHRLQRDGAAWFTEWLTLPQLVQSCAAALTHAQALSASMGPNANAMRGNLDATDGMLLAEALSFALAGDMPRPDAQAKVKTLCAEARETGRSLRDLALVAYPDLPDTLFDPTGCLGSAPDEALGFARAARAS